MNVGSANLVTHGDGALPDPGGGASKPRLLGAATVSVVLAVVYLGFALAAYLAYPGAFSAWHNNWLSDLGNRRLNPDGWAYYAIGCGLTGLLAIVFFGTLSGWRRSGTPVTNRLLTAMQVLGMLSGLALFMTAIYTEDHFGQHQFWSRVFFGSFAMAVFVTPLALRRRGQRRGLLNGVCLVAYLAVIASLLLPAEHWLEWACVALLLGYAVLLGIMTSSSVHRTRAKNGSPSGPA